MAVVGPDPGAAELIAAVRSSYRPHLVLAAGLGDGVPLLEGRGAVEGRAAAYVCEHFVCQAPVLDAGELAGLLSSAVPGA